MDLHFIAQWLDTALHPFDSAILAFFHGLAEWGGAVFTPIANIFALIGDNGYLCFLAAFVLLLFPKTRKAGVCIIGAVLVGAIITNLTLKETICRARPYMSGSVDFEAWWRFIGAPAESEFSFPSGHTTAAMAGALSACLCFKKLRIAIPALCYAVLMGMTRNYLMVHYPTDVIAGLVAGSCGAVAAYFITKLIFKMLEKHSDVKLFNFALTFDVRNIFRKKENKDA